MAAKRIQRIDMLRFLARYISAERDSDGRREIGNKGLSNALQQEFNVTLDPSTVSRMIKDLWATGALVEWADFNSLYRGTVTNGVSRQLRRDFNLKESLVVEAEVPGPDANETRLHYVLGNEAAAEVRAKQLFRGVKHLGVGPGRTMLRYAESIMNRPPDASGITISPLAGRLWVGNIWRFQEALDESSNIESPLDADFSALFIARGLHQAGRENVRLSQISHLAYVEDQAQAAYISELRCPFFMSGEWNEKWGLTSPERLVFGTASLAAKEHRVPKLLSRTVEMSGSKSVFDLIQNKFEECTTYAAKTKLPPLADHCIGLFPTLPLPFERDQYSNDPSHYESLSHLVRELNALTISVNWKHLRQTLEAGGISQLIAGGVSKHRAVWTLLLPSVILPSDQRLINSVCTDSGTAEALRRALRELRKNEKLLQQYEQLLNIILN